MSGKHSLKTSTKLILLILFVMLTACSPRTILLTASIPGENPSPEIVFLSTPSPEPTFTQVFTPTPDPTQTPSPYELEVVVWREDPLIPILNYHRFLLDYFPESVGMKVRLSDFKSDLDRLYDAGYTLISLDDLLSGHLIVPKGRHPLVLSIDDGYFADQLFLDEDGTPSTLCGVGVLYAFWQNHPDFGFEVPMFAIFGDKYYGNSFTGTWWIVKDGWEEDLTRAIIWGIENGVMPYNHLFTHAKLDITPEVYFQPQLAMNDQCLRDYLVNAGRSDLVEQVNNYIALPFGVWPATNSGKEILYNYTDPEGRPVRAIFEAGYEYSPQYAFAPFTEGFDPFKIPRMAGIGKSITHIVDHVEDLPAAETCLLIFESQSESSSDENIKEAILIAVKEGGCPEGVYILEHGVFRVSNSEVIKVEIPY